MLGNVLPGLRELRAPLAAGYLWVVTFWLIFGDELPTASEPKPLPFDRLYRLEPIVSSVGLAVVASVAAYLVGSVAIDVQTRIGAVMRSIYRRRLRSSRLPPSQPAGEATLALTPAGRGILARWAQGRGDEVKDLLRQRVDRERTAVREARGGQASAVVSSRVAEDRRREGHEDAGPAVRDLEESRVEIERASATANLTSLRVDWIIENTDPARRVGLVARSYISSNRDLLKTQLLDLSQPLHSEIDRPDAEATFRMALWPPLAVVVLYVAVAVSKWWIYALTLPLLLVWQWISLRRQANDALVAAFVAKEPGGENAASEIRNTAMTELLDYEASSRRDHALRAAAERGAAHTRPVTSSPTKRSSGT
jgi:hypothetical protein